MPRPRRASAGSRVRSGSRLPSDKPAKGSKPVAGKPAAKAKGPSIADLAAEALVVILGKEKGNTIATSKVSMAVLKTVKGENKEAIREYLLDDDNLGSIEGVTYNAKKGTLTLDAE